jgi:transposase-like protein
MVREVAAELGERHGAIARVAKSLGIGTESVRLWVRRAEVDEGDRVRPDHRRAHPHEGVGAR